MRGGQSENDLSLKEREDAIWGKAYEKGDKGISPSKIIQVVVDVLQKGTPIKPVPTNDIPGYAAFPLLTDQDAHVRQGVQFILTITYPARLKDEIEAALWAWETFGGLGARARRGFGALHLVAIDGVPYQSLPTSRDVERWIRDQARKYSKAGNFPPGVPHLSGTLQLAVTMPSANPMMAWKNLVRKLQDFRQQKDAKRRSVWPEADTIREVAGTGPVSHIKKFPRAAFGLPIIFHFTGRDAPTGDYTLNEADTVNSKRPNKERFASPLILRPFLCSDKQAVGLVLLLEGSCVDLQNLVLQDENKQDKNKGVQQVNNTSILNGVLTPDEARAIAQKSSNSQDRKDTLRVLQNETDVLQAFLKSFKGDRR